VQPTPLSTSPQQKLEEEVEFWRDFATWWEVRHDQPLDDRILEALQQAERRLAKTPCKPRLSLVDASPGVGKTGASGHSTGAAGQDVSTGFHSNESHP
jgi:hypothetical protein